MVSPRTARTQSSCDLQVEVYESLDDCRTFADAQTSGNIVADGTCRSAIPSSSLLPGIYRAECTDDRRLVFSDSGCNSLAECEQQGTCESNRSGPAFLYAFLHDDIPSYATTNNACYSGSYTNQADVTITISFKISGACDPDCATGTDPPTDPPVAPPTDPPTASPTPEPTPEPTSPPTIAPTPQPVDEPEPTTDAPPVAEATDPPAPVAPPTDAPIIQLPNPQPTIITPTMAPSPVDDDDDDPTTRRDSIQTGLRFFPLSTLLSDDQLAVWADITTFFLSQSQNGLSNVTITNVTQQSVVSTTRRRRHRRVLQQQQESQQQQYHRLLAEEKSLEIFFGLQGTHHRDTPLVVLWEGALDTASERTLYLQSLIQELPAFEEVESVRRTNETSNGGGASSSSSSSSGSMGVIVGIVVAVVVVVGIGLIFFLRRRRGQQEQHGSKKQTSKDQHKSSLPQEPTQSSADPHYVLPTTSSQPTSPQQQQQQQQQQVHWTNEITVNIEECDDISTLEVGTLPDMATGRVYDDPTATIDINQLKYQIEQDDDDDEEGATAFSKWSKMVAKGSSLSILDANDDDSFEAQFATDILDVDDDDRGTKVKPFVVEALPGIRLGMAIETGNNLGAPYVKTIREESPFRDSVKVGDLVIAINQQDVTGMNAMAVSELMRRKQDQRRKIVFVRPE